MAGECRCPFPSVLASTPKLPSRVFLNFPYKPRIGIQPSSLGFIQTRSKASALGPCNNDLTVLTSR